MSEKLKKSNLDIHSVQTTIWSFSSSATVVTFTLFSSSDVGCFIQEGRTRFLGNNMLSARLSELLFVDNVSASFSPLNLVSEALINISPRFGIGTGVHQV